MSRKIGKGLKFLLIALIILNVVWTISLFRNNTNRHNFFENSVTTVTEADRSRIKDVNIGDPIDVLDLPHKINSWNLLEKDLEWFFIDDEGVNRPLLYNGHDVSFTQLSPSHEKLGFFFRPEGHSLGEIVLVISAINKKTVKEIYRGDTRTSNWEWKGDDAVIVKRSCGTGCMNAYVIDIMTGKKVDSYRVY